jgi:diguanylate cyclase (GGDEF)-like protein
VLAVLIPTLALVAAIGFDARERAGDARQATEQAASAAALHQISELQVINVVPEIVDIRRSIAEGNNGFLGDLVLTELVNITVGLLRVALDQASLVLNGDAFQNLGADERAAFQYEIDILELTLAELEAGRTIQPALLAEVEQSRVDGDRAFARLALDAAPEAWISHVGAIEARRAIYTEFAYALPTLLGFDVADQRELAQLAGIRETAVSRTILALEPDLIDQLEAVLASQGVQDWEAAVAEAQLIAAGDAPARGLLDIAPLSDNALLVFAEIEAVTAEMTVRATSELVAAAELGERQRTRLLWLTGWLLTVTVLLTLLILRSILGPLRRLTGRVRDLAEGRFDRAPVDHGRHDAVAELGSTVEEVANGLRHLDRQFRAMAEGRLDDPSLDSAAPGLIGVAVHEQLNEVRRASDALHTEATVDQLTGLLNRRGLLDRLEAMLSDELAVADGADQAGDGDGDLAGAAPTWTTRRLSDPDASDHPGRALFYLDLNRFKAVNDNYGHAHGDAVLQVIGQRLSALARSEDAASRLGGDEFVLVVDGMARASAPALVSRIEASVIEPIVFEGQTHRVGCSVGVSWLDDGKDLEAALEEADHAMLEAKYGQRTGSDSSARTGDRTDSLR